jgi:triosephosphate isomerase
MNGDRASIRRLLDEILKEYSRTTVHQCQVMVFPSYVHLSEVADRLQGKDFSVGAQDVDHRVDGAITGGVSGEMLEDIGCSHVLVGHSERRTLFEESDELVAEKTLRSLACNMTPVVCVGETLEERRQGKTLEVVTRQLNAVLARLDGDEMSRILLAYEPVWAIGTGESATPEQAEEVHLGLRSRIGEIGPALADEMRILYGGSVNPEIAEGLFAQDNVDGALVGGAALNGKSFAEICRAAEKSYGNI